MISEEEELEIKNDVEIIRPHLIKLGYDFTPKSDVDYNAYCLAKKGNLRYLAFCIYNARGRDFFEQKYNRSYGQIIYDTDGNILLDCVKIFYEDCLGMLGSIETYKSIDPSDIFMDDMAILTNKPHNCHSFLDYYIYKLKDGKYEMVKCFKDSHNKQLKTSGGDILLKCTSGFYDDRAELFDIRKLKKVRNLVFDDIFGVETLKDSNRFRIRNLKKITDDIYDILHNNNLLFAYLNIDSRIRAYSYYKENDINNTATVFAFLDPSGNIASKLYYKSDYSFYEMDIDNKSYSNAIKICNERLDQEVQQEIDKIEQMREEKRMKLLELSEQMKEVVKSTFVEENEPKVYQKVLDNNK